MNIKQLETRKLQLSGKVSGVTFDVLGKHAVVNTAFAVAIIDPNLVNIKIWLKRGDTTHLIANDTLAVLHAISNFQETSYPFIFGDRFIERVAPAAGVAQEVIIPYSVNFPTIDVRGTDEAWCEVKILSGAFTAATVSTADSLIDFNQIDSINQEWCIPFINSKSIGPGEATLDFNLGDNVTDIMFLNLDKSSNLSSSTVCSQFDIMSNQVDISMAEYVLKGHRLRQSDFHPLNYVSGSTVKIEDQRFQSYMPYSDPKMDLDNCRVSGTLTAANVNTGKNFVVWRSFYTDAQIIEQAQAHAQADLQRSINKLNR